MINTIQGSVGQNARNRKQDVGVVQHLLNLTSAVRGVPKKPLTIDGIAGPKTIAAIREYQAKFCKVVDGRVDPNNETIARLNLTSHPPPLNNGVAYLEPNLDAIRIA